MIHFRDDIPFDQYGRYRDMRSLAELYYSKSSFTSETLKILDIGGFFKPLSGDPYLPITLFFPDATTVVLDRTSSPTFLDNYLLADGIYLPFPDKSFDWINAADMIEHVPREQRFPLIKEMLRCSRNIVTLSSPIGTREVDLAEELVLAFIRNVLGIDHGQLLEHRQCGLPTEAEIKDIVEKCDHTLYIETFPSGNLYRWIYLMISRHLYISLSPQEGINPEIDRLYNSLLYESDHTLPTYRNIYFISKKKPKRNLRKHFDELFDIQQVPVHRPTEALIMDIFSRIEDQQRWSLIRELQKKVEHLTRELSEARSEANYYQRELTALSEIPPVKIWRKLKGQK